MPQRQKILIALVTTMLVVYVADLAYRRLYAEPVQKAQTATETLKKRLHKAELNVRAEKNKLAALEDLQIRSLPSNLELAVSSYRSWLLNLIEQAGLRGTSVDSSPPLRQGNLYYRLDFNIRGNGTLPQINNLLRSFYESGYLHKIRSMSLNPAASGQVDTSITVETIVLPNAKFEDRLAALDPQNTPADEYRVITRRNLFSGGDPVASRIALTAITVDAQGQPQAWITDRSTGQTRILAPGDSLALPGIDLKIVDVSQDGVTVELDGQSLRLSIGMTLSDALRQIPPAR